MPRAGNGTYSLPANTAAVSGDPISSTKYNTLVQDLESDANVDRPIAAGGTGASTAAAARTNLGLAIGTDVQAFDAGLLSIAGLTTLADRSIYTTASDTYAVYTLTAAGRAILDDADAAAQRTTLGLGSLATLSTINNDNWSGTDLAVANGGTGASDASTALTNLGALAASAYTASDVLSKLLTVDGAGSGLDADLIDGVQPSAFALTILDDADAAAVRATIGVGLGTGDLVAANNLSDVANASTARTNLGLAIGTNVQAFDAGLQSIAGLTTEADRGIYTTASDTYAVYTLTAAGRAILDDANASAQRTTLGLGSLATLSTINNSNWSGTALAIANGGTGATSAGAALTALGALAASSYTASDVLTKLLTVDGAGSSLDADTLDGIQASAFAPLASPALTGTPTIDGAAAVSVSATQTLTNKTLTSPTINGGTIQSRPQASSETTGTLTASSANKTIQLTGDPTINNSVFAAGDIIVMYAGASARTITAGTITTMRLGGSSTTGSRTLAARGVAVLFFVSASEVVVSGGAVT